jgi:hypothetical protein
LITKAPTRRFLFQNRQAAAAAAAEQVPAPTPMPPLAPMFARFTAAFDRIAASLDEIRAGLDRVAAVLEQMPLDIEVAADLPENAVKPPRKRRTVATEPTEPDVVQGMLPLLFS